jgi:uncharacterized protein
MSDPRFTALVLLVLEGLFLARVLGQVLVVTVRPRWLPGLRQWQSGLLPYPVLLLSQVTILAVMSVVALDLWLGGELISPRREGNGGILLALSYIYAAGMVVRYVIRMARRPAQRWCGGTIPIFFHVVLATWLWVLGSYWTA